MIRVLIADDQALVRGGFAAMLSAQADIEVVAEAADGREAVERSATHRLDVVLMDIRMPNLDGIAATRRLLADRPDPPKVMMLTTFGLDEYVYDALQAGASGFLLKDVDPPELIRAVRVVHAGEALLDPSITRRLIEQHVSRPAPGARPAAFDELTERELDVFRQLARGLSNAEIAGELFLSPATVKTHVARIFDKLGVRDRVQAVVRAYEAGLVAPGG